MTKRGSPRADLYFFTAERIYFIYMHTQTYDVIVIGGGPAGMMAAGCAALRKLRVLLIEKNGVLGKKLSITGGGRCNVTNAEFDVHTLLRHYGHAAPFLFSSFAQFGVEDTFDFFCIKGSPTCGRGAEACVSAHA